MIRGRCNSFPGSSLFLVIAIQISLLDETTLHVLKEYRTTGTTSSVFFARVLWSHLSRENSPEIMVKN